MQNQFIFQRLDLFRSKQIDQKIIHKYSQIKSVHDLNLDKTNQIFDYLNVRIYNIKFSLQQKNKIKQNDPILQQKYLQLMDFQFRDTKRLKGIRYILREQIFKQFYNDQLVTFYTKIQQKSSIQHIYLLSELIQLMNIISNTVFRLSNNLNQKYKAFQKIKINVIKNLQSKISLININQQYKDLKIKLILVQIRILQFKLISKLINRDIRQLVERWKELMSCLQSYKYSDDIFEMAQSTLMIFKNKFNQINHNKQDNIQFKQSIIIFYNVLNLQSKSWNALKMQRFILYIYSKMNSDRVQFNSAIDDKKLFIKHMKLQFSRRLIFSHYKLIQAQMKTFQNNLLRLSLTNNEDTNNQVIQGYNQTKHYIVNSLKRLRIKLQKLQQISSNVNSGKQVWELQNIIQNIFKKIQGQDQNNLINQELDNIFDMIQKLTIKSQNYKQFYQKIYERYQYFSLFIKSAQNIQQRIIKQIRKDYLKLQKKLSYLILAAVNLQNFKRQTENYIRLDSLNDNQKRLFTLLQKFNNYVNNNLSQFNSNQESSRSEFLKLLFKQNKFIRAWRQFLSNSNNYINDSEFKPYYKIQELYLSICKQGFRFDSLDIIELQERFSQCFPQIEGFEQLEDMIVALDYIKVNNNNNIKRNISNDANQHYITKTDTKINYFKLDKYIRHYAYQNQQQKCHKYVLDLKEHPDYQRDKKNKIQQLKNKLQQIRLGKCFNNQHKIVQIVTDENRVVIKLKQVKQTNFRALAKIMETIIRKYKKMINQQNLNKLFPYWYCYFEEKTFTIIYKNSQESKQKQFQLKINPYEPIFISLLLNKQKQEEQLNKTYTNHPFINLALLIQKQIQDKKQEWFKKYQLPQFQHLLNQMKILSIQKQNFSKNPLKIMNQCPYLWSAEKKSIQIIIFHQKYRNQINMQQVRRKNNQQNYQKLKSFLKTKQLQLDQQYNKIPQITQKKRQKLFKMLQKGKQLTNNRYQEQFNQNQINCAKKILRIQNQLKLIQQRIQNHNYYSRNNIQQLEQSSEFNKQLNKIKKYQKAGPHNIATQGFYSIEGVIQRAAQINNVHNLSQNQRLRQRNRQNLDRNSKKFKNYKWIQDKKKIEQMIIQISKTEQRRLIERGQQIYKDSYWKKIFPSFQFHLRNLRHICAHYVYLQRRQYTYYQKINIIQENYPQFFIFIYRWKNILGKPISYDDVNKEIIDRQYQKKQQKDIIAWINLTLQPLFNNTNKQQQKNQSLKKKRLKRVEILQRYLTQYNNVHLKKQFSCYEQPNQNQSIVHCYACKLIYYSITKIDTQGLLRNRTDRFWQFLNNIQKRQSGTQKHFNLLIWAHENQNSKDQSNKNQQVKKTYRQNGKKVKCCWADTAQTIQAFKNTLQRRTYQPEQRQYMESQNMQYQSIGSEIQRQQTNKQIMLRTDYIGRMFIFQLLGKFPNLINDIRYTRYLWDQSLKSQIKL